MKHTLISAFLLLLFFSVCGQPPDNKKADDKITLGKTESFYSPTLKEQRQLQVFLPASAGDTYFFKRHYPVVYVLDGDSHFYAVSAIIKQLSAEGGGLQFPEMIVVAILNTDRNRDLTPSRDTSAPMMDKASAARTGGSELFLSFITSELIPHIDSLYPTAPYRVLVGHSLGGLTVLDALVQHPPSFNAYIAIDPSMMWDNGRLLRQSSSLLVENKYPGRSLFLAIANSLQDPADSVTAFADTGNLYSRHMRAIFQTRNLLSKTSAGNQLAFGWKFYPEYNHGSVPLVAEYDALRFIFACYRMEFPFEFFFKQGYKGDSVLEDHYREVSRRMGYRVAPPEEFVNSIGYGLMQNQLFQRAFYFFDLNRKNYPESFNVYDSLGDLYAAWGKGEKAIESFKTALGLREWKETRKKLEGLEKK